MPTRDRSDRPSELQRVLDAVLDGVVVLSPEGVILRINAEACRILEASGEVLPGQRLDDCVGSAHPMMALIAQVQRSRRPMVEDDVHLTRRFDGNLEVDVAVSPLSDGLVDEPGTVVVLRDRTAGNSLREEASQRDRLTSYGHIAAGIAHEVKNPLGGIRGAAELLQSRSTDERSSRTAELIVREVDRISALIDDLMVFARGDKLEVEARNLHRILDGVLELCEADPMAAGVAFDRVYDPSIPDIFADGARLTQVFLNLARNAVQALGESGGVLTITTRMLLQRRVVGRDGRPLPTVEVTFADDGPGIAPELMDRLATPFFTTRPQGTGLGLAVSRHWVTRHGGRLQIESNAGHGATIRVALPLDVRELVTR